MEPVRILSKGLFGPSVPVLASKEVCGGGTGTVVCGSMGPFGTGPLSTVVLYPLDGRTSKRFREDDGWTGSGSHRDLRVPCESQERSPVTGFSE